MFDITALIPALYYEHRTIRSLVLSIVQLFSAEINESPITQDYFTEHINFRRSSIAHSINMKAKHYHKENVFSVKALEAGARRLSLWWF